MNVKNLHLNIIDFVRKHSSEYDTIELIPLIKDKYNVDYSIMRLRVLKFNNKILGKDVKKRVYHEVKVEYVKSNYKKLSNDELLEYIQEEIDQTFSLANLKGLMLKNNLVRGVD